MYTIVCFSKIREYAYCGYMNDGNGKMCVDQFDIGAYTNGSFAPVETLCNSIPTKGVYFPVQNN